MPIAPKIAEDLLILHGTRNGLYTIKSAYRFACTLTIEESNSVEGNWKAIWELKIAPRIKVFMWRAARDCLPSKDMLINRGIQVEGCCAICEAGIENLWHVLVGCSFAWEC